VRRLSLWEFGILYNMRIKCNNLFCDGGIVEGIINQLGEVESATCGICNGYGFIKVEDEDFLHPDVKKIIEIFNNQPGFGNWYKYLNEETKSTIKLQITNILDSAALDYDSEI